MRVALIALAIAIPATGHSATSPMISWGKPDVSLATYRAEAIGCAMRAYYTDVADTKAAKTFVEGTRRIDATLGNSVSTGGTAGAPGAPSGQVSTDAIRNATSVSQIVHDVHPEEGFREIKDLQAGLVAKCLLGHGYHRFHLTAEQRARLNKLKPGSEARHAFMHALASDPAILAAQSEPDPVITQP